MGNKSSSRRNATNATIPTNPKEYSFKVIIVGHTGVGKTCILRRYTDNEFASTEMTLGIDYACREVRLGDNIIKMNLWDTVGQERYQSVTMRFYRDASAAVLVYDPCSTASVNAMQKYLTTLSNSMPNDAFAVMVANKYDLRTDRKLGKLFEKNLGRGQALARTHNMEHYITSAKIDTNNEIAEMFHFVAQRLLLQARERAKLGPMSPLTTSVNLDAKPPKENICEKIFKAFYRQDDESSDDKDDEISDRSYVQVGTKYCVFSAEDVSGRGLTGVYRAFGDGTVYHNTANSARIQWQSTSSQGPSWWWEDENHQCVCYSTSSAPSFASTGTNVSAQPCPPRSNWHEWKGRLGGRRAPHIDIVWAEAADLEKVVNTKIRLLELKEEEMTVPAPMHKRSTVDTGNPFLLADLKLKDFRVIRRIGKKMSKPGYDGCNAAVYLARPKWIKSGDHTCALKVIFNISHAKTVDLSRKHGMEYLLVGGDGSRLPSHPRVLKYFGHFTDTASKHSLPSYHVDPEFVHPSSLFVVMELMDMSLRTLIKRRSAARAGKPPFFSQREIIDLIGQLANGIVFLHEHGICHRDLKPDNLLLKKKRSNRLVMGEEYFEMKIADFGECLDSDRFCRPPPDGLGPWRVPNVGQSPGGARAYLAPEVIAATKKVPSVIDYSKNDCYALGVVLYEMLMGECTLTNSAQFVDISSCYSASIRNLADSLLQVDPTKRPGPEYLQGMMLSLGFEDWV